jgi:hydrogenase expression/formation protein HypD
MKYLDEYRDETGAQTILGAIERQTEFAAKKGALGEGWTIMEVCGGQTHTLVKSGIDRMLPAGLTLVHGPGCPVCVTSLETIDRAIAIASRPEVIFTSFGDMLRVPGSSSDLLSVKARGGDVRMVYSPLDALELAQEHPDREVVFFAVGFETTAPGNAMAVWQADSSA